MTANKVSQWVYLGYFYEHGSSKGSYTTENPILAWTILQI